MVRTRPAHPLQGERLNDFEFWLSQWASLGLEDGRFRTALIILAELAEQPTELDEWQSGDAQRLGLEMASIAVSISTDPELLLAALLYRAVREGLYSRDKIEFNFGKSVRSLIEGTLRMRVINQTPARNVKSVGGKAEGLDVIRRMLVSLVDDPRVAILKLVERTSVIRAVKEHNDEHRERVAQEVFDIYAPLAHRLGIGQIRWELEDFAFRYLQPQAYKTIAKQLAEKREERESYIEELVEQLKSGLERMDIQADISWRAKHIFSIWRKMQKKNLHFDQVYDVRAVRLLLDETRDCYAVLGLVHSAFKHLPGEFDDYIAQPKPNGYRSLHTAVLGPEGKVVEIQIRTKQMHEEAEYGVCAHYLYKGHDNKETSVGYEQKVEFFRQVLAWHDELDDGQSLLEAFKNDAIDDRVYAFTPGGDVVDLPRGSTPLVFAYKVHTEVGHRCRGAKVSGRIVSLTYKLEVGDRVEILTTKESRPSRDWLNAELGYVTTSRARSKIHSWFRQQDRDDNLREGKALLESELKRLALTPPALESLVLEVGLQTSDELYIALGAGDLRLTQVIGAVHRLLADSDAPEALPLGEAKHEASSDAISVQGVGNLASELANCCKPVPGDPIGGFVSRGRGISIHRKDCAEFLRLESTQSERIVDVQWGARGRYYPASLYIHALDRTGLLRDVSDLLASEHCNVLSVNTQSKVSEGTAEMRLNIEVDSLARLSGVLTRLNALSHVLEARREQA